MKEPKDELHFTDKEFTEERLIRILEVIRMQGVQISELIRLIKSGNERISILEKELRLSGLSRNEMVKDE